MLPTGEVTDVLLELLADPAMQAATQAGLDLPPGQWRELVTHENARTLPVTYKYRDQLGHGFKEAAASSAQWGSPSFTIGDVMEASATSAHVKTPTPPTPPTPTRKASRSLGYDHYRKTL